MKIPSANSIGNGYFNYGDSYILDNVNSENSNEDSDNLDGDFSEYLWMENEEEFDKEVMQQLEEEALMEQCIEAMLEDELSSQEASMWSTNHENNSDLSSQLNNLKLDSDVDEEELVKTSKLNPLAAEFVPGSVPRTQPNPTTVSAKSS